MRNLQQLEDDGSDGPAARIATVELGSRNGSFGLRTGSRRRMGVRQMSELGAADSDDGDNKVYQAPRPVRGALHMWASPRRSASSTRGGRSRAARAVLDFGALLRWTRETPVCWR